MPPDSADEPVAPHRVYTSWYPEYGDEYDAIVERQERFYDSFKRQNGRPPTNREWDAWQHDVVDAPGRLLGEARQRHEAAQKALSKGLAKITVTDWKLIVAEYWRVVLSVVAVAAMVIVGIVALNQNPEILIVLAILTVVVLILLFAAAAWPLLLGLAALVYLAKNC
jgi:hypothetical protein